MLLVGAQLELRGSDTMTRIVLQRIWGVGKPRYYLHSASEAIDVPIQLQSSGKGRVAALLTSQCSGEIGRRRVELRGGG